MILFIACQNREQVWLHRELLFLTVMSRRQHLRHRSLLVRHCVLVFYLYVKSSLLLLGVLILPETDIGQNVWGRLKTTCFIKVLFLELNAHLRVRVRDAYNLVRMQLALKWAICRRENPSPRIGANNIHRRRLQVQISLHRNGRLDKL